MAAGSSNQRLQKERIDTKRVPGRQRSAPGFRHCETSPAVGGRAAAAHRSGARVSPEGGAGASGIRPTPTAPLDDFLWAVCFRRRGARIGNFRRSSEPGVEVSWNRASTPPTLATSRSSPRFIAARWEQVRIDVGSQRCVEGRSPARRRTSQPAPDFPALAPCRSYRQFVQKALVGIMKVCEVAERVDASGSGDPRRSSLSPNNSRADAAPTGVERSRKTR